MSAHRELSSQREKRIAELLEHGARPLVHVIESGIPELDLFDAERRCIQQHILDGHQLLNRNGRGQGGLLSIGYRPTNESNDRRSTTLQGKSKPRYTEEEKRCGNIYALVDPRNNEIMYVGKTGYRLQRRIYHHLWGAKNLQSSSGRCAVWMRDLVDNDLEPIAIVLEKPLHENLFASEKKWIRYLITLDCNLLNRCNGGYSHSLDSNEKRRVTMKARWESGESWNHLTSSERGSHTRKQATYPVSCVGCRKVYPGYAWSRSHQSKTKCKILDG